MATTTTPITVERYREVTLPGDHKQLVEGEIVLDEPSFAHALLQGRVFTGLVEWVNSEPGFVPLCSQPTSPSTSTTRSAPMSSGSPMLITGRLKLRRRARG